MELNDRDRAAIAEHMREMSAKRAAKALPGSLADATFDADDGLDPATTETCRRFVEGFDRLAPRGLGLVLFGPVGTGKTWHAGQIANALIGRGRKVLFSDMAALDRDMRADYGRGSIEVEQRIKGADLVVIDDLGVERATPAMVENVFRVVNCIRATVTPAVYTTNLDPMQMLADGDPSHARVYSRIMEVCRSVKVNGCDRRQAAAQRHRALFDEVLGPMK